MADDAFGVGLAYRAHSFPEEHPETDSVRSPLEEANRGLPALAENEIAGRGYSRRARPAVGTASGVPGPASAGAPPSGVEPYAEVVGVPPSQGLPEGGKCVIAPGWALASWTGSWWRTKQAAHSLRGADDADGDNAVSVAASGAADPARPTTSAVSLDAEASDLSEGGDESDYEATEGSDSSRSSDSDSCADEEREEEFFVGAPGSPLNKLFSVCLRQCRVLPSQAEFLTGIRAFTDDGDETNEQYSVVRALCAHSTQWCGVLCDLLLRGVSCDDQSVVFCNAFPNLHPASGGDRVAELLEHGSPAWEVLRATWGVRTVPDFLKHLFAKHGGEARLVGGATWTPLREDVRNPKFWSCHFARTAETRQWLAHHCREDPAQWLTWEEVQWLLDEHEGQTLLIRRDTCCDGGARFYFRTGSVVSLPEMMFYGLACKCTCFDVYKLYVSFEIIVRRRDRSGTVRDRKKARSGTHWWGER